MHITAELKVYWLHVSLLAVYFQRPSAYTYVHTATRYMVDFSDFISHINVLLLHIEVQQKLLHYSQFGSHITFVVHLADHPQKAYAIFCPL